METTGFSFKRAISVPQQKDTDPMWASKFAYNNYERRILLDRKFIETLQWILSVLVTLIPTQLETSPCY